MAIPIVAICTVQFLKLYTVFRKKEPTSQGICNFFFKIVKKGFSRFSECLKTTCNSPEQPTELTQK